MNIKEKYLPIGTVVLLNGAEKKIMITSFCIKPEEDLSKMYDYGGCLYPEGMLSFDKSILFNHSQINKIYHIGYINEEEKQFKEGLNQIVDKIETMETMFK